MERNRTDGNTHVASWKFTARLLGILATFRHKVRPPLRVGVCVCVYACDYAYLFLSIGVCLCTSFGQSSSLPMSHTLPHPGLEIPTKCFNGQNNRAMFTPSGVHPRLLHFGSVSPCHRVTNTLNHFHHLRSTSLEIKAALCSCSKKK